MESRRSANAESRRAHILSVARRLFLEHGFHGTGVALISQKTGIAIQQLYRDFKSKEDLIAAVADQDIGDMFSNLAQAFDMRGPSVTTLEKWLVANFQAVMDPGNQWLILDIFAEAQRNQKLSEALQRIDLEVRQILSGAIGAFVPNAIGSKDLDALLEILLTIIGGLLGRTTARPEMARSKLAERAARMIANEIRAL